jgi:biotin carboxyl carrier protein
MKYSVRIDDQEYTVEINDLRAQPVVAIVDGTPIEVYLPNAHTAPVASRPPAAAPSAQAPARPAVQAPRAVLPSSGNSVRAPIPGVIQSILVKPGMSVTQGQELFVIEAMKMKNTIRSPRDGVIAEVLVAPGTTVNHNAPVIAFAEE